MTGERVLLAIPVARDPYEKGGGANLYFANLGLAYLGAFLRARGHAVRLFDGVIRPSFDALAAEIADFRPTHVGLSAFTVNVRSAERTARWLRERHPDVTIALGGSHAVGAALESIEEFPDVDYVIGDEGELAYGMLIESSRSAAELARIPALAWRRDGEPVLNPRGSYPDFEDLPRPAWDLFDLDRYKLLPFRSQWRPTARREFQVLTARGCPFRCSYCSHASGFKVRGRSVDAVVDEIRWLIRDFQAQAFFFSTETFTLDRAHTVALLEAMIAARVPEQLYWGCMTRVDTLDRELIALLARAGCTYLSMGLESGTQGVLDSVDRGHQVIDVPAAIEALHAAGIQVHSNFLIGLPGETPATIRKTIDLAVRTRIDYASFCIFVPYPGSALAKSLERDERYRVKTRDWDHYRNQAGTYLIESPELSEKQVGRLHAWAYFRFYGRIGYWLRLMKLVTPTMIAAYVIDAVGRTVQARLRPAPVLAPGAP